jgi:uncharacterized protein
MEELELTGDLQGTLLRPARRSGLGVVVLAGTSGRVDIARANLFAARGAVTLAQRWFGGPGQSPGICLIAVETFMRAVDRLIDEGCDRIAIVGTSKGAEAALLMAVNDPRVNVAVALSPTPVAWVANGPGFDGWGWYARSSWTLRGTEIPFMAVDPRWRPAESQGRIRFRTMFETSMKTFAEDIDAATILVEQSNAAFVLVGGGDDAIWPSDQFAAAIAHRLTLAGKRARLVTHPRAGHRVIFPGEPVLPEPEVRAWGGDVLSDRELGATAWSEIEEVLGFDVDANTI